VAQGVSGPSDSDSASASEFESDATPEKAHSRGVNTLRTIDDPEGVKIGNTRQPERRPKTKTMATTEGTSPATICQMSQDKGPQQRASVLF